MTNSPDTKLIPLTQGKFAIVDAEDFERVTQYNWHLYSKKTRPGLLYAITNIIKPNGKRTTLGLHIFIIGKKAGKMIDHINHDGLDNRKINLRFCSNAENRANYVKRVAGKSPYKGVTSHPSYPANRQWKALIKYKQNPIFLGYFATPEEAALAYNEAAKKYFGEFAYLNEVSNSSETP